MSTALGQPGIPARWTSSAKVGVGTALSPTSHVWVTLSHGIFNEIYCPRIDRACTRDLGMIVTEGHSFFSEEKRHTRRAVTYLAEGVPAYRLVKTCSQEPRHPPAAAEQDQGEAAPDTMKKTAPRSRPLHAGRDRAVNHRIPRSSWP